MQPPLFDAALPKYILYGALGFVGGHELAHAFDSSGRQYDEHGNYTDWWDPATVAAYEERAQCFVRQYDRFSVERPNGRLTLSENVADAGGLAAAFDAWRALGERDEDLPGLERFTHEQLFFVSFAQSWCAKVSKEEQVERLSWWSHAPPRARVLGATKNSRAFREAFGCDRWESTCGSCKYLMYDSNQAFSTAQALSFSGTSPACYLQSSR
jgi:endothelin-converting enzyme